MGVLLEATNSFGLLERTAIEKATGLTSSD